MHFFIRAYKRIDWIFERSVQALIIVLIMSMTLLVVGQVILRNIFSSGITWADIASRHMVLWVAFLGAMLATRSRQHIAIDALTRLLPERAKNGVRIGLDALAAAVTFLLAKAALAFVLDERAVGTELGQGFPAWLAQSIIPFGFAMISLEYAIGVVVDIVNLVKRANGQDRPEGETP